MSVLSEGWSVTRSVLSEGSLFSLCCVKDRPVTKTVLGEGSAYYASYTREYEWEKPVDVHGAFLGGSQRDKCKKLCATINRLEEIPEVWN